jgi:hypothetical protein
MPYIPNAIICFSHTNIIPPPGKEKQKERKKANRRGGREGMGAGAKRITIHFPRLNCVVKRMRISARLLLPGSPPHTWRNSGLIRYVFIAVLSKSLHHHSR